VVKELLGWYEEGAVTEMEVVINLVREATRRSPEEMAPLIPANFLEAVRKDAMESDIPKKVFWMGSWAGPVKDPFNEATDEFNTGAKIWKTCFERRQDETGSSI